MESLLLSSITYFDHCTIGCRETPLHLGAINELNFGLSGRVI